MLIPVILLFLQAQYWHGDARVVKSMSPTKNAKILGGHDIDITEAPYQVSVHVFGIYLCGGVLVDKDIVLTSAYFSNFFPSHPALFKIRAGSSIIDEGGELYQVEKIVVHPYHRVLTYDLAIFKLSKPVTLSDKVAPIPMMESGEEVPDGANLHVTGWGMTENEDWPVMLQRVEVTKVNWDLCLYQLDPNALTEADLCAGVPAGDKGFYRGDKGGPLVYNGKLAGVSSRYITTMEVGPDNTTIPRLPDQVYTKVSALRSWIDETIQNMTSHI
ncbi:hypothetical protein ABMA28_010111 [Loxostege sticticalis]|uniref:Peptidase S1 domain-containing protein n=1 Tax=Loxostege sticticalis TaxID=481309 RepID=A0ABD0SBW1_LOXSC